MWLYFAFLHVLYFRSEGSVEICRLKSLQYFYIIFILQQCGIRSQCARDCFRLGNTWDDLRSPNFSITWFVSYLNNFEVVNKLTTMEIIFDGNLCRADWNAVLRELKVFFSRHHCFKRTPAYPIWPKLHHPLTCKQCKPQGSCNVGSMNGSGTLLTLRLRKVQHINVTSGFLPALQQAQQTGKAEVRNTTVVVQYQNYGSGQQLPIARYSSSKYYTLIFLIL